MSRGMSAVVCEVCKERMSHHGSNAGQVVGHKPDGTKRMIHAHKVSCQKKWKEQGEEISGTWVENKGTPKERRRWPPSLQQWVLDNVERGPGRQAIQPLFHAAKAHPLASQWQMHDRSYLAFAHGVASLRRRYAPEPEPAPALNGNGHHDHVNGNGHALQTAPSIAEPTPVLAAAPASSEVVDAMIEAIPPMLRVLKQQGKLTVIETIFDLVTGQ